MGTHPALVAPDTADSGLTAATASEAEGPPEIGLVLGTMFGSLRTISEFDRRGLTAGPNYTKPMDFANSVLNAAAGQAAIWHRLTGANATVAGGTTAGLQALASAADLVRGGRAEAVLAGGAEELCPETLTGFAQAGLLCREEAPPVPFHAISFWQDQTPRLADCVSVRRQSSVGSVMSVMCR